MGSVQNELPLSLGALIAAARAPRAGKDRADLVDICLDLAVLDVRKFESALLKKIDTLEQENAELKEERDRARSHFDLMSEKHDSLSKREKRVRKREVAVEKREEECKVRENRMKRLNPGSESMSEVVALANSILEYMVKCEELVGNSEAALRAREGLNETSSIIDLARALPNHMAEVEQAFDQIIENYRRETDASSSTNEQHSKSGNAIVASRIREKKALREKAELLQSLSTVHKLTTKMASEGKIANNPEMAMVAQVLENTAKRFQEEG